MQKKFTAAHQALRQAEKELRRARQVLSRIM
jgi:hypothetical protein